MNPLRYTKLLLDMFSRRLEPEAYSTALYGGQNVNPTADAKNTRKKTKRKGLRKANNADYDIKDGLSVKRERSISSSRSCKKNSGFSSIMQKEVISHLVGDTISNVSSQQQYEQKAERRGK